MLTSSSSSMQAPAAGMLASLNLTGVATWLTAPQRLCFMRSDRDWMLKPAAEPALSLVMQVAMHASEALTDGVHIC